MRCEVLGTFWNSILVLNEFENIYFIWKKCSEIQDWLFFPSPFWNTFITVCVRNLSVNYSTLDHIYSRWEKKKTWHHCSGGINLILRQALKTGQIYHYPREELICLHQLQRKPGDKQPPFQAVRADKSYPRRRSLTPLGWAVTGTLLGRASGLNTRERSLKFFGKIRLKQRCQFYLKLA